MKRWQYLLFGFLVLVAISADELKPNPEPTIESLKAEVQTSKAEVQTLKVELAKRAFEVGLCNAAVQSAREQFVRMLGSPIGATPDSEVRGNGPRQLPGSNPAANGGNARIQPLKQP